MLLLTELGLSLGSKALRNFIVCYCVSPVIAEDNGDAPATYLLLLGYCRVNEPSISAIVIGLGKSSSPSTPKLRSRTTAWEKAATIGVGREKRRGGHVRVRCPSLDRQGLLEITFLAWRKTHKHR